MIDPRSPLRDAEPADRRAGGADFSRCLTENELLDLIEQRHSPDERGIASHLDACNPCRELLAELIPGERSAIPQVGSTLGRYQLLELAGAGATGLVYLAADPQLGRQVALKLLRPTEGPEATELRLRLIREAQALARLSHPNVVAVHDVGTVDVEGKQLFLAMDFVEGGTLTAWLAAQPRTWREVLAVFRAAGEGLAAAHEAGLVHRDFKPDNVLVGRRGEVRVTDFGLARWETAEGPPAAASPRPETPAASALALTHTGVLIGTPAYMAPEQLAGRPADARSDLFSFCSALYEGLYGERPFAGHTVAELEASMAAGRVRPALAPRRVPEWLRQIVRRGLEFDPAKRPSLRELLRALDRGPSRRGLKLAIAGLALLGIVAAVEAGRRAQPPLCADASASWGDLWSAPQRELARQGFAAAKVGDAPLLFSRVDALIGQYRDAWIAMRTDACRATRIRGEQSEALLDLRMGCLDQRRREARALLEVLTSPSAELVSNAQRAVESLPPLATCADTRALAAVVPLPTGGAARAEVGELEEVVARAQALYQANRIEEARAMLVPAIERARKLGYAPIQAQLLYWDGRLAGIQQVDEGLLAIYHSAATLAVEGREIGTLVDAWSRLAFEEGFRLHRPESGRTWLRYARAAESQLGADDLREAELLRTEVAISQADGHLDEAVEAAGRAYDLAVKAKGAQSMDALVMGNALGTSLEGVGKLDEALQAYQRAHHVLAAVAGEHHGMNVILWCNEAEVLRYLGRPEEALALDEQAARLDAEEIKGHATAFELGEIAASLRELHRYAEALADDQRALTGPGKGAPGEWWTSAPLYGLGLDLLGLHRSAEAIAPLEQARQLREHDSPPDNEVGFALAQARWESGDHLAARPLAQEAHDRLAPLAQRYHSFYERRLEEIDRWLAEHPPTEPSSPAPRAAPPVPR